MEDLQSYQNDLSAARGTADFRSQYLTLDHSPLGYLYGGNVRQHNMQALANQREANAFNSAEAAKNRNFQKMMSDTSYQRAAKDLEAVGFSPLALLGPGGGAASTPSGSAASSGHSAKAASGASAGLLGTLITAVAMLGLNSSRTAANLAQSNYYNSLAAAKNKAFKTEFLTSIKKEFTETQTMDRWSKLFDKTFGHLF